MPETHNSLLPTPANDNTKKIWDFIKENRVAIGAILSSAACGVYLEVRHNISALILSAIGQ